MDNVSSFGMEFVHEELIECLYIWLFLMKHSVWQMQQLNGCHKS